MRETNQRRTWPWVLGDLAVIAAIVLFAVLALALRDSVARLADMATGIRDTGTAIQTSGQATAGEIRTNVGEAAESLANVPFIGQDLRSRVQRTGDRTADAVERESRMNGARLVATGRQGQRDVLETARLVGWLAFLVPSVLLLAIWLPRRLLVRRRHESPQRADVPQRGPRQGPVRSSNRA